MGENILVLDERYYAQRQSRLRQSRSIHAQHQHAKALAVQKKQYRRAGFLGLTAVILIAAGCIIFGSFLASAQNSRAAEPVNFKYYKSIVIQPGDTLWELAEEYMTDDFDSIPEYLDALMTVNHLNDDNIQEGQNLIVAYNSTEYK